MADITRKLARFITASRLQDIPAGVRHEGERALLNWMGCALGGCRDVTIDRLVAALQPFAGQAQATLLGRGERLDALSAALINAVSSNVLDFDDTHLRSVIHPTVPVAAAVLALAEHTRVTGAELLHAFILGAETECRIGNAVSPEHYDIGWHITSTCGVFGAAAACGKLLELTDQQMTWALGLAATQAAGLTCVHGTMSKSFNMGHAARNGLAAALLAAQDFTSTEHGIEAPRGFAHVLSPRRNLDEVLDALGTRWELLANAYKPYPCGIVVHPVIDACLDMRGDPGMEIGAIEHIELRVHPLVIQLTGNPAPATGLEAKLSTHHCAAAALLRGTVGVAEFLEECVRDPAVLALRARVTLTRDAKVPKEAADVTIRLAGGRSLHRFVAHATGSLEKPMSDAQLEAKFRALAAMRIAPGEADALLQQCRTLASLPDAAVLARGSVPRPASAAASAALAAQHS